MWEGENVVGGGAGLVLPLRDVLERATGAQRRSDISQAKSKKQEYRRDEIRGPCVVMKEGDARL